MVESLFGKQVVVGSIPTASSNNPEKFSRDFAFQKSKHWQLKLCTDRCHLECGYLSNLSKWKDNKYYQLAKNLGPDTIPVCLKQMRCNPSWIHIMLLGEWAGSERPTVAPENYGKFRKIVETWLSWGLEKGYIK